jgi:glycosyltransferase involved in cell wall biosynthesis
MPKASVIICTKNEAEGLQKVLENMPKDYEIIVVDSSDDETPQVAENYGVIVIPEQRSGKGRAMKTGVENAKCDVVVFMDGDGTDDPRFLDQVVSRVSEGVLVFGIKDWVDVPDPIFRAIHFDPSKWFRLFSMIGIETDDALTGYRAMRTDDFLALDLQADDFFIETEMNINALLKGMQIEFVTITGGHRRGKSKFLQDRFTQMRVYFAVTDAYNQGIRGGVCPVCKNQTLVFSQDNGTFCPLCGYRK